LFRTSIYFSLTRYIDTEKEKSEDENKLVEVSEKEAVELKENGIIHIKSKEQFEKVLGQAATLNMPVLVKFTASWCKPCKRIAPKFEALSKEHKNSLIFLEVDFDSNQKLAKHLGAGLLPTFQLYR